MKSALVLFAFSCALVARAEPVDVYIGTGGGESRGIYRAKFDPESGKLGSADLVAEVGGPGFLAFNPKRTHLYAVARTEQGSGVVAYRISKDGSLTFINSATIDDGGGTHVAVHPSGRFLLTAQYGGGSTAVFPLNEDGSVGARTQLLDHEGGSRVVPNRQEKPHPHWCGFSPDGRFAFVPDLGLDKIVIYRVNEKDRAISHHGYASSVPGGGPRHMRFSINGKFIYLLNELTLSVTTFGYDAAGGRTEKLSTTPSLSEEVKSREAFNSASEILVHPNGRFVYSANRGHDSVTVYHADRDSGELEVIEVEAVRGSWPRNINLESSGRWMLAAGAHSNTLSVFAIDADTGELQFKTQGVINVPNPICILFND